MQQSAGLSPARSPRRPGFARHALAASIAAAFGTAGAPAWAQLPTNGQVVHGHAAIATTGNAMTVTNSPNAVLNWDSFSIGGQNSVRFEQDNAASKVLNRVVGNDPSSIFGSLSSNGAVWLINPHGVLFGQGARVDVAGLVASTLTLTNEDFLAGRARFDGARFPGAAVMNAGEIQTSFGGHVWLTGGSVGNTGLIVSPGGQIVLAAGKSIELVDSGMPRVNLRVRAPENEALNLGTLLAPGGGSIDLHGGIVNQGGIVRADSLGTDPSGRVVIRAQGDVHLRATSRVSADSAGPRHGGQVTVESIDGTALVDGRVSATSSAGLGGRLHLLARQIGLVGNADVDASGAKGGGEVLIGGDYRGANPAVRNAVATFLGPGASVWANATQSGDGGKVIVWADSATRVHGSIAAQGGPLGGDGGFVETSGRFLDARPKSLALGAARGRGGTWLLDPGNITITEDCCSGGYTVADSADFSVTSDSDDAVVSSQEISSNLSNGINVIVSTGEVSGGTSQLGNITVENNIFADDANTPGSLTLRAHNNITVNEGVTIESNAGPMDVTMISDFDTDGSGGILLDSGSAILTAGGNIRLQNAAIEGQAPASTISIQGATLDAGAGTINLSAASTELNNATLISSNPEDAILIRTGAFSNTGSALQTDAGRWLIHFDGGYNALSQATFGGLTYAFVEVGTVPGLVSDNASNGVSVSDPLEVRVTLDAARPYDGTTNASFTGALASDIPDGLVLAVNDDGLPGQGSFDNRNVGVGKQIFYGDDSEGPLDFFDVFTSGGVRVYGVEQTYTGDITPKSVTYNIAAADKVYDATRTATLTATVSGLVAGDAVALSGLSGLFDSKNAGAAKTVTVSGATLTGLDAPNYALTGPLATTADITPRPVSTVGIVGADKVYDGTRRAFISSASFAEMLPGDSLATGTTELLFEDKNVGTGKLITYTSSIMTGADAPNYVLVGPLTTRGSITPRPVEIGITGQVGKEYDATTSARLDPHQFVLNGAIPNDALAVSGPSAGVYDTPSVGAQKGVTVSGNFDISGADAPNYRVGAVNLAGKASNPVSATAGGKVGTITPATLLYQATPAVRPAGVAPTGLDGTVTGFRGADALATATTGNLLWTGSATQASPPGNYAINGGGLLAANYVFAQAPGNAAALTLEPSGGTVPAGTLQTAQESSTTAFNTALHAALIAIDPRPSAGGVFDISSPAASRSFAAVRIGSMNQDELAQMLEQRRNFKRKLFADAVYKLEIDPSLADVQPCATVVDAGSGACRITRAQLDLIHGSKPKTVANARKTGAKAASLPQIERKIALLVGINDYQDKTIPRLENAVPDVDAIGRLFADKLGYEVRVLRNPNKADIIRSLNQLSTEIDSSDSVVVYYAGHGYSLEKNGAGYWLPTDAMADNPRQWISNSDVAQLLAGVRSKQMALISDSCYSGAFARDGMDAVGLNVSADDVLTKRSVVVLSSGGDEPVADEGKDNHSIFAWNLMQVVGSVSNWKPGSIVFNDVQAGVRKEFPQTPKYGSVTAAGHQRGGDYLFELR